MPLSAKLSRRLDKLDPALKDVLLDLIAEIEQEREASVTRLEFTEFARKTEEHFQRVWKAIQELAQAQKRTEQRLEELAQAQERTEQQVEELAHAQKRTEQRLEELARAQTRTEEAVYKLTRRVDDLSKEVGSISNTVGYALEDRSYPALR